MSRFRHYICNQIAQSGIVLLKMIGARAIAVETLGIVSLALKSCPGLDGSCKKKEISHRIRKQRGGADFGSSLGGGAGSTCTSFCSLLFLTNLSLFQLDKDLFCNLGHDPNLNLIEHSIIDLISGQWAGLTLC